MSALPSVLVVGAVQASVALPVSALTVIVNGDSDALDLPSLTVMVTPAKLPTLLLVGVPLNRPVAVLKLAQTGLLTMLKPSASPLASAAVGLKL